MSGLRLVLRLTAFGLFLLATVWLATGLLVADVLMRGRIDRTPWARRSFHWACRCLGLQVQVHGDTPAYPSLIVSNHISWSDIPILGSLTPVLFLSKAEVRDWPIIGWLAEQAGTLFIKRGGGRARRVRRSIADQLEAGQAVLVFPEGTTGQGKSVLPFHGLLLGAAADTGRPIQPVTISYRRQGQPDPVAPFVGDDAFHHHLLRLLSQPPTRVDVLFHPAFAVAPGAATSETATAAQAIVADGLNRLLAGALDEAHPANATKERIRTAAGPERSRLRSLPDGQQFPDRNTG